MLIKRPSDILPSEITPEEVYRDRRRFLRVSAQATLAAGLLAAGVPGVAGAEAVPHGRRLSGVKPGPFSTTEAKTPFEDVTTYNNYYEFGTGKGDPARNSTHFRSEPWHVTIDGECEKPGTYALEDLLKPHTVQERIYRLRCVEAWSMVIPWDGIPLAEVLKRFKPTSKAKFVEFVTLYDPKQMPGQRVGILDWPYVEGLRIDEAMHPLTLLGVGVYGEVLPNQNGAPLRLVVPWKYGFKSIKAIVGIRFTETQPVTTWHKAGPSEYGFYSNVNPHVDHARWTQARERRIGEFFKRKTLMFNGYADQVASLYSGMDLKKYF